ncbi:phosphatases II [Clavulina sp. PMI_390]|nr:phosphatases II [Clavulina sp. PMI_390]
MSYPTTTYPSSPTHTTDNPGSYHAPEQAPLGENKPNTSRVVRRPIERSNGGYFIRDMTKGGGFVMSSGYTGANTSEQEPAVRGPVSQVAPRVYLTDVWNASDPAVWEDKEITHILTVMRPDDIPPKAQNLANTHPNQITPPTRLVIPLADSPSADLLSVLPSAVTFISSALSQDPSNNVLVHCFAGKSRSASCVAAYLIETHGLDEIRSLEALTQVRAEVQPNKGFQRQLQQWYHDHLTRQAAESLVNDFLV